MTIPPHPWLPIRTRRLLLRDFRASDFQDVHAYGSDLEVTRYMPWGPNTPDDTRAFLDREHTGTVIGSISLHLRDGPNRTVELGYCLHRDLWRRGIVSEAARALIDTGFRTLGLHRIFATCDVRNTGSFGVMETLGMRREGCLRLDQQIKDEWRSTYIYAVLAEEWMARV